MPAGMTSLPMPSPAITAILYVLDMYESHVGLRLPFYVCRCVETSKVITQAPAAAARPPIAGVTRPHPRPAVRRCTASAAHTPAIIVASAPDADVRRT